MTELMVPETCTGHERLTPTGDLDLATAPALRERLVDISRIGPSLVVVDLAQVPFLDSVGMSVLIGGHKRLRHSGGRLCLAAPTAPVRRVLGLARLDSFIPLYDTVPEAEADCPSEHEAVAS